MNKSKMALCLLVTGLLSHKLLANGWGNDELFKQQRLALAVNNISQFSVDVGAGELSIVGQSGQSEIIVTAKVYGEDISEEDYDLRLERVDNQAVLIAHFNNNTYNNEKIDLEVSMPETLALLVDDRSGDLSIESVKNGLKLNDRSGEIELLDIQGPVKINDRSGDITAKNIQGEVSIEDRSGDLVIKNVVGDLSIEDSSGDIRAKNISGLVTVEDSSGDIDINGAGNFKLIDDGSGGVYLRNIRKNLQ